MKEKDEELVSWLGFGEMMREWREERGIKGGRFSEWVIDVQKRLWLFFLFRVRNLGYTEESFCENLVLETK